MRVPGGTDDSRLRPIASPWKIESVMCFSSSWRRSQSACASETSNGSSSSPART